MAERTTMAPTVPQTMAFFCRWDGRLRAARAITMALSPASTRSMRMIAKRADHQGAVNNSKFTLHVKFRLGNPNERISGFVKPEKACEWFGSGELVPRTPRSNQFRFQS